MRGFFLSLDAIVASGLIIVLAVFIAGFSIGISNDELQAKQAYYIGKDINNVLFEVRIAELANLSIVQDYLSQGIIEEEDLNLTFIELVGYWWAMGNDDQAESLTKEFLDSMVNDTVFGYELLFDNTSIYARNKSMKRFLFRTTSIITGVELGKQPKGFAASAFATSVRKNTTIVHPFDPEGSAVEVGERALITKKFFLDPSKIISIQNATLYISIHYGTSDLNSQNFFVNDETIDWKIIRLHGPTEKDIDGSTTHLFFGVADVTDKIDMGWNSILAKLKGDDTWYSHIHPGFRLELEVEENMDSLEFSSIEDITYYFNKIDSQATGMKKSGAWETLSFFIPQGAVVREVDLFVKGVGVNNVHGDNIPDNVPEKYNVQVYLNNLTIGLENPDGAEIDELNVSLRYNITDNVTEGTNVVSVYLNCYGDDFWGIQDTILWSDPEHELGGTSYLRVEYDKPPTESKYGQIQVGIKESLGGVDENPKTYTKGFGGSELFRTFLHLATLDNENVTVNTSYNTDTPQTAFSTPRPFATPTTIFIDPQILSETEDNTIEISDTCTDLCDILPESSFEHFIWVPSMVGYGDIFPTSTAATQDAMERLADLMGHYVEVTNFVNDTQNVPEVPSLWGPAKMEVRVWL